jgi:hypothetical protein
MFSDNYSDEMAKVTITAFIEEEGYLSTFQPALSFLRQPLSSPQSTIRQGSGSPGTMEIKMNEFEKHLIPKGAPP